MLKGSSNSAFDGVKVKYLRKGVEAFNALLSRQSSWLSICWCYTKRNLISSQARSPSTSPATSAVVLMICVCFAGSKKKRSTPNSSKVFTMWELANSSWGILNNGKENNCATECVCCHRPTAAVCFFNQRRQFFISRGSLISLSNTHEAKFNGIKAAHSWN